jgi:signal transduction histidine kinase
LHAAHQAQQDGLRVILHDFRTPMASLRALTAELADPANRMDADARRTGQQLTAAHVEHLTDMLDALSDVAASRSPFFGRSGDMRSVDVHELMLAAGAAAGLRPPRLRVEVSPVKASIRTDAQGLRRVLVNLLDNAARQGRERPVDAIAQVSGTALSIQILDRGPGLAADQLRAATQKNVSFTEAGGAGLGLWIVEQILQAMDGELELGPRPGGGLAARVRIPLGRPRSSPGVS